MTLYEVPLLWRWGMRVGLWASSVGGALMLAVAAMTRNAAALVLILIGGVWFVSGIVGLRSRRRTVETVTIEAPLVTFASPGRSTVVAAEDVLEIVQRKGGNAGRFAPVQVITRDQGTISLSAEIDGLLALVVDLHTLNPGLQVSRWPVSRRASSSRRA